jgi:hypothetical protein
MSTTTPPDPPVGSSAAGRRLWRSIVEEYELEEHELALLREMTRTVDQLESLAAVLRREGVMHDSPQGQRAHPALIESRQLRIALARLQAALRLPAGEDGGSRRPQRRMGVRGVYGPRSVG